MKMLRLREKYNKEVVPAMQEKFGYKNKMAVPKLAKVTVNTGIGRLIVGKTSEEQKRIYQNILDDLALICGQRPVFTKSRKSIAGFKTREGMLIGAKITLRGKKMYDFLERVIHITLPRIRDFRGIDLKCFDKDGNLTIPIKEHLVFPEISPERVKIIFGLEITIVTTAKNREKSIELLRLLGFPIKIKI